MTLPLAPSPALAPLRAARNDNPAAAELLDALDGLAGVLGDGYVLEEMATTLSCTEADKVAAVLALTGYPDDAAALLAFHATDDDDGDPHRAFAGGEPDHARARLYVDAEFAPRPV